MFMYLSHLFMHARVYIHDLYTQYTVFTQRDVCGKEPKYTPFITTRAPPQD